MARALISIGVLALLVSGLRADDLNIVLRFEPHRDFTPAFRRTIRDRVHGGMTAALDGLSRVRVFDYDAERPDDRLPSWNAGINGGPEAVSQIEKPAAGKTHFVWINWRDGAYEVRSRQIDGTIAWTSPVARRTVTPDREFVATLIQQQLALDYGLTGIIVASDGDRTANVQFSASAGGSVDPRSWIKPGDVFAVVQPISAGRSRTIADTLLVATQEPSEGKCDMRIESRFVKPLEGHQPGKLRAVKLGAEQGPVQLRLMGIDATPIGDYAIQLSTTGFDKSDVVKEQGIARRGRFTSMETFDRIAYARVLAGDRSVTQMPIAILGDTATMIEIGTAVGERGGDADVRLTRMRLLDLWARAGEDFEKLKQELLARRNNAAKTTVETILKYLEAEVDRLAGEVAALKGKPGVAPATTDELERYIRDLQARRQSLRKTRDDLERAIKAAASPEAADKKELVRGLFAKADHANEQADFDQVIAAYEEILKQAGDWPEVQTKLADIKTRWAIKSEAHATARAFAYGPFSIVASADDVEKHLPKAVDALATFKAATDTCTPRKLYLDLVRAANLIARRDEELRRSDSEEAVKQADSLRKISAAVRKLMDDVEAYVKSAQ